MEKLTAYINETLPELHDLIVTLCGIPAPSHHEEKRAEFCWDWLIRNGADPARVRIDPALNTVYEMMAIDVTNGSNVIVMSEKLPLAAMTVDQYIAAMEQQLSQTTMSIDFGDPEPYTLGSTEFTCLSYSVEANGARMNQLMLLKKVDDRMYAITISYPDTVELAPLLACFSPTGNSV